MATTTHTIEEFFAKAQAQECSVLGFQRMIDAAAKKLAVDPRDRKVRQNVSRALFAEFKRTTADETCITQVLSEVGRRLVHVYGMNFDLAEALINQLAYDLAALTRMSMRQQAVPKAKPRTLHTTGRVKPAASLPRTDLQTWRKAGRIVSRIITGTRGIGKTLKDVAAMDVREPFLHVTADPTAPVFTKAGTRAQALKRLQREREERTKGYGKAPADYDPGTPVWSKQPSRQVWAETPTNRVVTRPSSPLSAVRTFPVQSTPTLQGKTIGSGSSVLTPQEYFAQKQAEKDREREARLTQLKVKYGVGATTPRFFAKAHPLYGPEAQSTLQTRMQQQQVHQAQQHSVSRDTHAPHRLPTQLDLLRAPTTHSPQRDTTQLNLFDPKRVGVVTPAHTVPVAATTATAQASVVTPPLMKTAIGQRLQKEVASPAQNIKKVTPAKTTVDTTSRVAVQAVPRPVVVEKPRTSFPAPKDIPREVQSVIPEPVAPAMAPKHATRVRNAGETLHRVLQIAHRAGVVVDYNPEQNMISIVDPMRSQVPVLVLSVDDETRRVILFNFKGNTLQRDWILRALSIARKHLPGWEWVNAVEKTDKITTQAMAQFTQGQSFGRVGPSSRVASAQKKLHELPPRAVNPDQQRLPPTRADELPPVTTMSVPLETPSDHNLQDILTDLVTQAQRTTGSTKLRMTPEQEREMLATWREHIKAGRVHVPKSLSAGEIEKRKAVAADIESEEPVFTLPPVAQNLEKELKQRGFNLVKFGRRADGLRVLSVGPKGQVDATISKEGVVRFDDFDVAKKNDVSPVTGALEVFAQYAPDHIRLAVNQLFARAAAKNIPQAAEAIKAVMRAHPTRTWIGEE
jgi:hypothetical protein